VNDQGALRKRYLRDALPVRLGGLAANLARITSFSDNDVNCELVERLLNESKFFIEWTAGDADIDTAAELVQLQLLLAAWQWSWKRIWSDPVQRQRVTEQARDWSGRVLERSGLLKQGDSHEDSARRSSCDMM